MSATFQSLDVARAAVLLGPVEFRCRLCGRKHDSAVPEQWWPCAESVGGLFGLCRNVVADPLGLWLPAEATVRKGGWKRKQVGPRGRVVFTPGCLAAMVPEAVTRECVAAAVETWLREACSACAAELAVNIWRWLQGDQLPPKVREERFVEVAGCLWQVLHFSGPDFEVQFRWRRQPR